MNVERRFPVFKPVRILLPEMDSTWRDCLDLFASPPQGFDAADGPTKGNLTVETLSEGSVGDTTEDPNFENVLKQLPLRDDLVDGINFRFYVHYRSTKPVDTPKGWRPEFQSRSLNVDLDQDSGVRVNAEGEPAWVQRVQGSIVERLRGAINKERLHQKWGLVVLPFVLAFVIGTAVAIVSKDSFYVVIGGFLGFIGSLFTGIALSERPNSLICVRSKLPEPGSLEQLARAVVPALIGGAIVAVVELLFLGHVI